MENNIPAIGQPVPDFEVPKADGSPFRLSDALKSGKNIKLMFYRGHW